VSRSRQTMTIPAWSEALPKLYDLYSCSDRTDPNNYFNAPNVMQALDDCDSGLKEIESDLQPIDGEAWKEFKFKTVPYVTATDRWGWNTQLFDRFNEVKGYVFLKQQGYLDIYFIAEVPGKKTPDLSGKGSDGAVLLEVKTVHESDNANDYMTN